MKICCYHFILKKKLTILMNMAEFILTQRWYMESLQWRRGDVNMDGVINSADANAVSQYLTGSSVFTSNIQKFLADANLDGIIDVSDVSYINLGLC